MRIPKRYGQSRINNCPFCGKIGVTKNKQGVPVCLMHKDEYLSDVKCVCGEYLDVFEGKWGPYFRCMNCGNINFKKGLDMNPQVKDKQEKQNQETSHKQKTQDNSEKKETEPKKKAPTEITVTSDQVDFMY